MPQAQATVINNAPQSPIQRTSKLGIRHWTFYIEGMSRLIGLILILALAAAFVVGGSWALAYNGVATLLGDPPPQMGTQTTTFLWDGLTQVEGAPRVWSFAFYPTLIPGAQSVRMYVTPTGRVVWTEPADLAARVKKLHDTGY